MSEYSSKAVSNFTSGCNCAQSVLSVFSNELGLSEEFCLKLASSFGGGMGRLREVCGAVTAMFIVAGILKGYSDLNDDNLKTNHYKLIQRLANLFKEQHGTIICRELLGINGEDSPIPSKRTNEYYSSRPCTDFIQTATEIIEQEILK